MLHKLVKLGASEGISEALDHVTENNLLDTLGDWIVEEHLDQPLERRPELGLHLAPQVGPQGRCGVAVAQFVRVGRVLVLGRLLGEMVEPSGKEPGEKGGGGAATEHPCGQFREVVVEPEDALLREPVRRDGEQRSVCVPAGKLGHQAHGQVRGAPRTDADGKVVERSDLMEPEGGEVQELPWVDDDLIAVLGSGPGRQRVGRRRRALPRSGVPRGEQAQSAVRLWGE